MKSILLLLLSVSPLLSISQDTSLFKYRPEPIESFENDSVTAVEMRHLDSLFYTMLYKEPYFLTDSVMTGYLIPDDTMLMHYNDSIIQSRLDLIPSPIPLLSNEFVIPFVRYYIVKRRDYVARMLAHSQIFFPVYEEMLDKKGLPDELKYIPMIESAFDPTARSRMGATGQWQIMHRTGKYLGLEINSLVDERSDIIKASDAATDYFKSLYNIYDDWLLAIAAYNSGPGNVNKAISKAGGVKNFWAIKKFLPRETQNYVPIFTAAVYSMKYAEEHGIGPAYSPYRVLCTDTFCLREKVTFEHLAAETGLEEDYLTMLNPSLKMGIVPKTDTGFIIQVPITHLTTFVAKREVLNTDSAFIYSDSFEIIVPGQVTYIVEAGDNLGYIAERFGCKVSDIKAWNDMYSDKLSIGQQLLLFIPKEQVKSKEEFAEELENAEPEIGVSKDQMESEEDCDCIYHVVKDGDTLWDIAQMYPGAVIERIMEDNNMGSSAKLKLDAILIINDYSE